MNKRNEHALSWRWAAVLFWAVAVFTSTTVQANYSCNLPTTTISTISFDPFSAFTTVSGQVSITCSKAKNDLNSLAITLAVDTGLNPSGGYSYAKQGSNLLRYDLLRSATTTDYWTTANPITATVTNWTGNTGTLSVPFYLTIPATSGSAPYTPTTAYTDTRIVSATYIANNNNNTSVTGNMSISINVPANCKLSQSPGSISFNYRSFQATVALATGTSFAVQCVNNTPYTMALDSTTGTLLGLNYSLSLSPSGQQTGNFVAQSISINGTMAANQSGACTTSCSASQIRVLTISY